MTDEIKPEDVARVQHRGRLLQIFLAPWRRGGIADAKEEPHLHVQDLDGGPGQILPLDSDKAKELAEWHPEVAAMVNGDSAPAEASAPASPPPYYDPPEADHSA